MARGLIANVGVTIDGKQAQDTLKALQTSVDLTSKKVEELKKKLDEGLFDADKGETESTVKQELKQAEKDLKSYKKTQRSIIQTQKGVDDVLANLSKSSYNELTRTRGLLLSSIKSLDPATNKYKQKIGELRRLNEEIVKRGESLKGSMDFSDAKHVLENLGSYSVDGIKEAISAMTKFRDTMTEDKNTWREWNGYVQKGEQYLKEMKTSAKYAEDGLETLTDTLKKADNLNTFKGTAEDLKKLKVRLEEIRDKEIKLGEKGSQENIKKINEALFKVEGKMKDVNSEAKSLDQILDNIGDSSLNDLERAAKELEAQIAKVGKNTEDYITKSARLRDVNKQIDSIKANFKEKESIIVRTGKRLASYVAIYAGFNEVVGWVKHLVNANLELSDSLADIQKTTGLTAQQVGSLSDKINSIDTRTAQQQLHELAYEAGKLGISAEEDILAFVKAGNQLVVALGEDLGGAEAVRELMKVNAILGETQNLGMERALLATGSAINEISQTSRASAGPIADVVSRIGAIGAAAKLQMPDLIALAGTADAMGQSAEVAGTAFNKFITTLQTNTVDVAYALGLDPDSLRTMLDSGQGIQAIIQIFEQMNQMGGLSDMGGIFKDLGSDGARMAQVLSTMAAGVEELKAQVFTSNKAFQEATSVTNEYNIKNESAAAILERMGNNLRESFVQSGFVEWIRDVLQWLYYLPQQIENNRVAWAMLRAVMWEIAMVSGAKLVALLGSGLKDAIKALSIQVDLGTKAWKAYSLEIAKNSFKITTAEALKTASGITKLRIAFATLGKVILANPIFFIGTALATAITVFQAFKNEVDENVKSIAELESSIQNEQYALRKLMTDINNANAATGERASLIKQLNDKYGSYLGFIVTESNYVENQVYIYDLLNAKLRESLTLKMNNKMMDDIATKYAGDRNTANKNILEGLYSMETIGESKAPGYMEKVMTAVLEQVKKGSKNVNEVMNQVFGDVYQKYLEKKKELDESYTSGLLSSTAYNSALDNLRTETIGKDYDDLLAGIKKMLEVETAISVETKKAQTIIDANNKSATESAANVTKEHLDQQYQNITGEEDVKTLQTLKQQTESYIKMQREGIADLVQKKTALRGLTFSEQKEYEELEKAMQSSTKPLDDQIERYNYLNQKKTVGLNLSAEEEKKIADTNAAIKRMEGNLKKVNQGLINQKAMSVWGDNDTLTDKAPKELAAMYTKLEEDASRLSKASFEKVGEATAEDGKKIVTQFWKNFDTRDAAIQWYKQQKDEIAKQLKSLGYNTSGHFIGLRGNGNEKKTAHQLYRELLSELEAYYNERETAIRQNGMKQGQLESEINREIENLQIQEWNDRIELEKALLDDFYTQSSFDPSKYMGDLTKMPYFAGVKMEEVRAAIRAAGPKLVADIEKSMTGSMVKIEEKAWQIKQRIEKILLEDDFSEQVAQQYLDSIDKLGLLFNLKTETSDHSEEEGESRLAYMREWSKESYSLTASDLQSKVEQEEAFMRWRLGRTSEDYEALLVMLRKFHDDQAEAERKAAERRKKIAEQEWNAKDPETGKSREDIQEERIIGEEADLGMYESARDLGLASERRVEEAQLAVIQAKIDKEQEYIKFIHERMQAEIDAAYLQKVNADMYYEAMLKMGLADDDAKEKMMAADQAYRSLLAQRDQITLESNERIRGYEQEAEEVNKQTTQRKMETLKGYTDAVVTFGEQMGEAAFGEVEDRKAAGKQLLKTTLQLTKDLIMAEVKRLVMKKALGQQEIVQEQTKEQTITLTKGEHQIANITSDVAAAQGENVINTSRAGGKTLAELGWWGMPLIAVIGAALSALLSAAIGGASKAKSEIAAATGASSGRLATGMLTYAEGNYPVLGNDGQVYNAKYEGAGMKTGIYGGGAHFGIFSEKKPEAIIDGDTTQRLILNHPDIWQSIVTLSKTGRLDRGMRTFASGNIGEIPVATSATSTANADAANAQNEMMEQLRALMTANMAVMNKLATEGVHSRIDMYGDGGLYKSMKKAESFANKRGYK